MNFSYTTLGTLPRQRRLAGRTGHGPQPGTLDNAHRSGRTGGNHQDPPTTLLLLGRTHHPQGTPPHPAPAPQLAVAKPVQLRPEATARPATPFLTAPDPSARLSTGLAVPRQVGPRASLAACCPNNLAQHHHHGPPTSPCPGYRTLHAAISIGIKPSPSLSLASHPFSDQHGYIPSVDSGLR